MDLDPPVPKCMTSASTSFAYPSVRSRWPAIITSAIDDLHRTISSLPTDTDPAKVAEGKAIIAALAALKYELQHNRVLTPLPAETSGAGSGPWANAGDVGLYNEELAARAAREETGELRWHDVEWLFSECYLYRRLVGEFARSRFWGAYDVFRRQKTATFRSSRPAVLELAARYKEIVTKIREGGERGLVEGGEDGEKVKAAERVLFEEMAEMLRSAV